MGEFSGKVVVITGAGSGIGRSTALLFGKLGAKVHVTDLNGDTAGATRAQIEAAGGTATASALDTTDPQAIDQLAERVYAEDRGVDVLHNNAGIGHAGDTAETTIEDWQRVIGVNLLGVAYGVQAFVPRMLGQGRPATIVNTASMAGLVPTPRMAPYCASKFGVVGMSEALNAELAPQGIHVSAICPGIINTAIVGTATMRGELTARQQTAVEFYEKRGSSPDVVAEAVVDAVRKRKLIQPVPKGQVVPGWLLHRVSARATQPLARFLEKVILR
jgi:NAD(P)-dependent dehydrogenase (short-subunit alcohol dehydrogenase family)